MAINKKNCFIKTDSYSYKAFGFTLIELVIVIVLLGILSATALPKFFDLTGQSRISANRGYAGGLTESLTNVRSLWLGQGSPATVTLQDGTVVHVNAGGWPDGIGAAAQSTDAGCAAIWNGILQNPTTAMAGAAGCGTTSPCYNAVYAAGAPETCTYTVNNFTMRVVYTLSGAGSGGAVAFDS